MIEEGTNLDSTLRENRLFAPPAEFAAKANVKSLEEYEAMYRRSVEQPEEFWAEAASELEWFQPWSRVLEMGPDGSGLGAKWFIEKKGKNNIGIKKKKF